MSQVLISNSEEGHLDLTATIPREGGLLGSSSHSDTLQLSLVEQVSLSPPTLDLFEMEVGAAESRGGLGYFSLATLAPGVEAEYSSSSRALSVNPLNTGVAKLALLDLCLAPHNTPEASLLVSVSGLAKLELKVPDKVQVGAGVTAEVTLLDQNQVPLQSPAMQHIEVELVAKEGVTLVRVGGLVLQEGARHQAQFQVEGLGLGLATLVARASSGPRAQKHRSRDRGCFPIHLLWGACRLPGVVLCQGQGHSDHLYGGGGHQPDPGDHQSQGQGRGPERDSLQRGLCFCSGQAPVQPTVSGSCLQGVGGQPGPCHLVWPGHRHECLQLWICSSLPKYRLDSDWSWI